MERRLWIGLIIGLTIGLFITGTASAQLGGNLTVNDSETSNVSVVINSQTWVDVNPAAFTWSGIDPGSVGDYTEEILGGAPGAGFFALQVENIGSHNISYVWFNATYPSASPFAVGSTANTDSGNYVVLSNATQNRSLLENRVAFETAMNRSYYFINRKEYNETRALVYVTDPNGAMPPNTANFDYGRFRNASVEFFWMLDVADGSCEDNAFYIGDGAHTKWTTGSVDFASGPCVAAGLTNPPAAPAGINDCRTGTLTNNTLAGSSTTYGVADVNIGGQRYCVAVENCSSVFFSKWNPDYPFNLCGPGYSTYVWNSTRDGPLTPGDSFAVGIKVYVPFGIYEGTSNLGFITAIVNDQ